MLDQAISPTRIELREHVVEQQHRRRPTTLQQYPVHGYAQPERDASLLSLTGSGIRNLSPETVEFTVTGIFKCEYYQYDRSLAILSILIILLKKFYRNYFLADTFLGLILKYQLL